MTLPRFLNHVRFVEMAGGCLNRDNPPDKINHLRWKGMIRWLSKRLDFEEDFISGLPLDVIHEMVER